jgi:cytochrome b
VRRALHWALVVSTALAALSLIDGLGAPGLHRPAGYAAVAVVLWRVAWGAARRRPARAGAIVRMLSIAGLAFTGWLYTTDAYWGSEAIEELHRALAWALLALVATHLAVVIFARVQRRKHRVQ